MVLRRCLGALEFLLIDPKCDLGVIKLRDNRCVNHCLEVAAAAVSSTVSICQSPPFLYYQSGFSANWLLPKTQLLSLLVNPSDHGV